MRKLVGFTLPLASLSIATIFACSSSGKKPTIIDGGSGSGSGSNQPTACSMDMDPACTSTQYCDTTNMVCVDICPNGPNIAPIADPISIGSSGGSQDPFGVLFHTEYGEAVSRGCTASMISQCKASDALGSGAITAGFDDKAKKDVLYNAVAFQALGSGAAEVEIEAEVFESGDCTAGASGCTSQGTTPESFYTAVLPVPKGTGSADGYQIGSDPDAKALFTSTDDIGAGRMIMLALGNIDPNTGIAAELYIGDAGNWTLPSAPTAANFTSHINDVELLHIDTQQNTVASDICTTTVAKMDFNVTPRASAYNSVAFDGRNDGPAIEKGRGISKEQLATIRANVKAWAIAHPALAKKVFHRE